jgi:hypothetical protein
MKHISLFFTALLISIFSIAQVQITSIVATDETCPGACDGTLTINTTGGTTLEMYDIGGAPQASNIFTGLCASTYTVTVNDALPSSDNTTATVASPTPITYTLSTTNCSAFGVCDGQATVTISGGTPPYLITYYDAAMTPLQSGTNVSIINLCAGSYNVSVTDANSCPGTGPAGPGVTPFTITEPAPPPISGWYDSMPTSCSAVCNGYATAMATGGVPPLTFSSPGYANVCDGQPVPSVTVTDDIGQTFIIPGFTMGAHPLPSAWGNLTITDESCPGDCDGTLDASNVTGNDAPFQYSIDGITFQTGTLFTGLCPSNYTLYISNTVPGCVGQDPFTISAATPIVASVNTITNASCPGNCDGDATLNVSGGLPPYTYIWNPSGCTSPNLGACGACAGTYSCTVTDANGCSTIVTNIIITQPAGTPITATWSTTPETCFGVCDGSATVVPIGGLPPYTYLWNDPCLSTTPTSTCAGCPGSYDCIITDATGCSASVFGIIVTGATPITIASTVTNVSCSGLCDGQIIVLPQGGTPPYTFNWTGIGTGPADTLSTIGNLCPGTFTVIVTDAAGCIAMDTINITEPPLLVITSSFTNPSCNGLCDGTITPIVTGGTAPYSYLWSPMGCTAPTCGPLCAGIYTLIVTDANGCVAIDTIILTEPTLLVATANFVSNPTSIGACDGAANGNAIGGTPGYVFEWIGCSPTVLTPPVFSPNINVLCDGDYQVVVTDANGCIDSSGCITITDPPTKISTNNNKPIHNIYPNPTYGIINIDFSDKAEFPLTFNIMDVNGRIVGEKIFNNRSDREMDLSKLSKGNYILSNTKLGIRETIILK